MSCTRIDPRLTRALQRYCSLETTNPKYQNYTMTVKLLKTGISAQPPHLNVYLPS